MVWFPNLVDEIRLILNLATIVYRALWAVPRQEQDTTSATIAVILFPFQEELHILGLVGHTNATRFTSSPGLRR